jgi:hypothetical protein
MLYGMRTIAVLLGLAAMQVARADLYGPTDVSLGTNGSDCLNHSVNWRLQWGAFPPLRGSFTNRSFAVMFRYGGGFEYHLWAPQKYPQLATLSPNSCMYVGAVSHYYRIQISAWGPGNYGSSGTPSEVSFVSPEVYTPWTQCQGPIQ